MPQVYHAVVRMGDTRLLFKCATAVRLCATCEVHVRHPAIPTQRARVPSVGKTPSFSFCQVDMYAYVSGYGPVGCRNGNASCESIALYRCRSK